MPLKVCGTKNYLLPKQQYLEKSLFENDIIAACRIIFITDDSQDINGNTIITHETYIPTILNKEILKKYPVKHSMFCQKNDRDDAQDDAIEIETLITLLENSALAAECKEKETHQNIITLCNTANKISSVYNNDALKKNKLEYKTKTSKIYESSDNIEIESIEDLMDFFTSSGDQKTAEVIENHCKEKQWNTTKAVKPVANDIHDWITARVNTLYREKELKESIEPLKNNFTAKPAQSGNLSKTNQPTKIETQKEKAPKHPQQAFKNNDKITQPDQANDNNPAQPQSEETQKIILHRLQSSSATMKTTPQGLYPGCSIPGTVLRLLGDLTIGLISNFIRFVQSGFSFSGEFKSVFYQAALKKYHEQQALQNPSNINQQFSVS